MNNNQNDSPEDDSENNRQQNDANSSEIAGSPGSHSNSSSSNRQHRIVELLQDNEVSHEYQPLDWTLRPEFYDIDVAQNSGDDLSSDEELGEIADHFDAIFPDRYPIVVHEARTVEGAFRGDDDDDDDDDSPSEDYHDENDDIIEEYDGIIDEDMDPDYVIEPYDEGQSTTDSEDEDSDHATANNYDTTLPVGHRYLGENLEESRGRRVFVEGSVTNLPLINLVHVVLFPGQVLPITTSNLNPRIQACLANCITSGPTIVGLLSDPHNNTIGTTAEIRNYSMQEDELKLIMEGRQRFELLSAPFEIALDGLIKILPEVILGRPYSVISPALLRFQANNDTPSKFIISKHPRWLLKRYEANNLMARILNEIKDWCSADLTKDPNDFSYWVASNLPISNTERIKALSFSCTEARLVWLLSILERSDVFGCSACKNEICDKRDVFPMSRSGPQCSFVNPGGFIHDTLTVRSARGLIQEYNWSNNYSWFPGYVWRMANCDTCHRHIGWCYKHIAPDTKPRRFFGLSRASIRLQSGRSSLGPPVEL